MRGRSWLVALGCLIAACRGDARTPAAAVTAREPARAAIPPDAGVLDEVDALVPPALRSRLTFEMRTVPSCSIAWSRPITSAS